MLLWYLKLFANVFRVYVTIFFVKGYPIRYLNYTKYFCKIYLRCLTGCVLKKNILQVISKVSDAIAVLCIKTPTSFKIYVSKVRPGFTVWMHNVCFNSNNRQLKGQREDKHHTRYMKDIIIKRPPKFRQLSRPWDLVQNRIKTNFPAKNLSNLLD